MKVTIAVDTVDTYASRDEPVDLGSVTHVENHVQALEQAIAMLQALPSGYGSNKMRLEPRRVTITFEGEE